ncbi:MAG: hypothetical protein WAX69_25685 [Victivallales bacterium]
MHNSTETIPLRIMYVERKTIPVSCPWCNRIFGVAKIDVEGSRKIAPVHKICKTCFEFVNQSALINDSKE